MLCMHIVHCTYCTCCRTAGNVWQSLFVAILSKRIRFHSAHSVFNAHVYTYVLHIYIQWWILYSKWNMSRLILPAIVKIVVVFSLKIYANRVFVFVWESISYIITLSFNFPCLALMLLVFPQAQTHTITDIIGISCSMLPCIGANVSTHENQNSRTNGINTVFTIQSYACVLKHVTL